MASRTDSTHPVGLLALKALIRARASRDLASLGAVVEAPPPLTLESFLAIPLEERPMFVIADGMGVDSLANMIGLWRLGLRPDAVLHADTGDEHPLTNAYRDERRRWLRSIGWPDLTIVRRPPSVSGVTGRPFSTLGEKCIANHTLPSIAFAGGKGCSKEWKIVPQEQYLAKHPLALATWRRGLRVVKAIGYDAGPLDSRRAHHLTADHRYEYVYPLREWGWARPRAVAEIRAAGLPMPRKSSCIFCSAMKPWEVAQLVRDWPALADYIVEIEDTAQPYIRIEGLWGKTVKGMRGAIPKPGSMAEFIREVREDRALLEWYLAMEPPLEVDRSPDVGQVPTFRRAPLSQRRGLPLYGSGMLDEEESEAA